MGFSLIQVLVSSAGVAAFRSPQKVSSHISEHQRSGLEGSYGPRSIPANGICNIGSGYSVSGGCEHSTAVADADNCPSDTLTCITEGDLGRSTGFNRLTRRKTDFDRLTREVVDSEFVGYGLSASAGADYLKSSKYSVSSMGVWCGGNVAFKSRQVRDAQRMMISKGAGKMMLYDPKLFLLHFGTEYVYRIDYGGSFLGSFTVTSRTFESQGSLDAFAGMLKYSGSCNAELGEQFNQAKRSVASNITVYASAKWSGVEGLRQDYSDPGTLGQMFDEWSAGVQNEPEPIAVHTRPWMGLGNFFEIVSAATTATRQEILRLMMSKRPNEQWRSELGQESVKLTVVLETIGRAMNLIEESNQKLFCLMDTRKKTAAAITRIQQLDDIQALEMDLDILQSDSLLHELHHCR